VVQIVCSPAVPAAAAADVVLLERHDVLSALNSALRAAGTGPAG